MLRKKRSGADFSSNWIMRFDLANKTICFFDGKGDQIVFSRQDDKFYFPDFLKSADDCQELARFLAGFHGLKINQVANADGKMDVFFFKP